MLFQRSLAWARRHPDLLAITIIIAVAVLLRAMFMFRAPVLYVVASRPYLAQALHITAGLDTAGLEFESHRRIPGYPLFLVGVIGLFGVEAQAIAAVQHLLGVGSAVLCYGIGRLAVNRIAGLAAGLLTALNGSLLIYEHGIFSEPLFTFLLLLSALLLVAAARGRINGLFLAAGFVIGATALTRPIAQALAIAAPIAIFLYFRRLRPSLLACAFVFGGYAAITAPWVLYNRLTHAETGVGHPGNIIIGTVMHERPYTKNFFTIDNQDENPTRREARKIIERMAPDEPDPLELWSEFRARLGVKGIEANTLMGEIAIDMILRHPQHYAGVLVTKVVNLFSRPHDEPLEEFIRRTHSQWPGRLLAPPVKAGLLPDLRPSDRTPAQTWELKRAAAIVDFFKPTRAAPLLAVLFLLGLASVLARPERRLLILPALLLLSVVVFNGVIAGDKPRYRYPLDPLIGVVAMGGVVASAEWAVDLFRRGLALFRGRRISAPAS